MKLRHAGVVVSLAVTFGGWGCGGEKGKGGTNGDAPTLEEWCGGLCQARETCDRTYDAATCSSACKNQSAAVFPKLRADVLVSQMECFASSDCKTVLDQKASQTCAATAAASVAPSDLCKEFCTQMSTKAVSCSFEKLSVASCLETFKVFADSAHEEGTGCLQKGCQDVGRCLMAAYAIELD